ncbi:hypothetical protein VTK56DRAFT_7652 [Thermocarpiscus australiensis]
MTDLVPGDARCSTRQSSESSKSLMRELDGKGQAGLDLGQQRNPCHSVHGLAWQPSRAEWRESPPDVKAGSQSWQQHSSAEDTEFSLPRVTGESSELAELVKVSSPSREVEHTRPSVKLRELTAQSVRRGSRPREGEDLAGRGWSSLHIEWQHLGPTGSGPKCRYFATPEIEFCVP